MTESIPTANLLRQYCRHADAIKQATEKVFESGWYILGREVQSFEEEFSAWLGASCCCGVATGTDALVLALRSCGIGAGDEVITVSHSAVATVAAIEQIGAVPVFVDIDPRTRCMDPSLIERVFSSKTRGIVPVHIFGQPAPMPEIMQVAKKCALKVVEDCAQAHGAEIGGKKVGTFGDAAAFSFYPTKNLGAMGDGGAVVTNDMETGLTCRWLREYGWKERYISHLPGFNSRLDELQAAILRVKLPFLEGDNERRRWIASQYTAALQGSRTAPPAEIVGTLHAMHLYVVETEKRNQLRDHLSINGVSAALHYPMPIHHQPAYLGRVRGGEDLPVTEALYEKILTIPMYPELTDEEVTKVCEALKSFGRVGVK